MEVGECQILCFGGVKGVLFECFWVTLTPPFPSMYGGGIHTARSQPKTTPTRGARMAKLENNILPKPSDGSADFNARKPKAAATSDFEGFGFYVLTDTPVR